MAEDDVGSVDDVPVLRDVAGLRRVRAHGRSLRFFSAPGRAQRWRRWTHGLVVLAAAIRAAGRRVGDTGGAWGCTTRSKITGTPSAGSKVRGTGSRETCHGAELRPAGALRRRAGHELLLATALRNATPSARDLVPGRSGGRVGDFGMDSQRARDDRTGPGTVRRRVLRGAGPAGGAAGRAARRRRRLRRGRRVAMRPRRGRFATPGERCAEEAAMHLVRDGDGGLTGDDALGDAAGDQLRRGRRRSAAPVGERRGSRMRPSACTLTS